MPPVGIHRPEHHAIAEDEPAVEIADVEFVLPSGGGHTHKTDNAGRRAATDRIRDHGSSRGAFHQHIELLVAK